MTFHFKPKAEIACIFKKLQTPHRIKFRRHSIFASAHQNSKFPVHANSSVMARDAKAVELKQKKMKHRSSRSWIAISSTGGEGTVLDFNKYEIMQRVRIHARDLRILDPNLSYPSTILCREKAIILNLEYIKAIITADEVLLRDPLDKNVIPVVEKLRKWLMPQTDINCEPGKDVIAHHDVETRHEEESPFEFCALEVALESVCSSLAASTTKLEREAYIALDELTTKISSQKLDLVRKIKSKMTRLTARVQKVRDELEQLLDDDEDMADLYLTRKLCASSSPLTGSEAISGRASRSSVATIDGDDDDVEELEMLLEAYFMQIEGTLNKLIALRGYTDDTEDYINIQLDNHRNQLIQLELFLSLGTLCVSIYSLVAGIFGMNIPFKWNKHHGYMFKWVVIIGGIFSAVLFILVVAHARLKGIIGS